MDAEIVNRFLDSAQEVLQAEVGGPISVGKMSVQTTPYTSQEITTLIGLTGHVQGVMLLGLSQKTAKCILSRMMGQEVEELDELAQSGIAEMGNVIAGMAVTGLSEETSCTISPPTLIMGSGATISTVDIKRLVLPVITPCGVLEMQLALKAECNATHSSAAKSLACR